MIRFGLGRALGIGVAVIVLTPIEDITGSNVEMSEAFYPTIR